jgi:hypothetical protein
MSQDVEVPDVEELPALILKAEAVLKALQDFRKQTGKPGLSANSCESVAEFLVDLKEVSILGAGSTSLSVRDLPSPKRRCRVRPLWRW